MGKSILLLLFAWLGPEPIVVRETVASIEVNHVYDNFGNPVLNQVIFRDWDWSGELQIVAWRNMNISGPTIINRRAIWTDSGTMRDVRASSVIETWTQYDQEIDERACLEKEKRRELLTPATKGK